MNFSKTLIKIMVVVSLLIVIVRTDVAYAKNTQIFVNGIEWYFDKAPIIENGEVFVSIRDVAEVFELSINWDAKEKMVKFSRAEKEIKLKAGETTGFINGERIKVPVPAKLVKGNFMVPLSFLDKALNMNMYWDKGKNRVELEDLNWSYEGDEENLVEEKIDLNNDGKKETVRISGREDTVLKVIDGDGRLLARKYINVGPGVFIPGGMTFEIHKNKSYIIILFPNTDISQKVVTYKVEGKKVTETYVGEDHESGPNIKSEIDKSKKLVISYPTLKKKYILSVGEEGNDLIEAGDIKGPYHSLSDYNKDGRKELEEGWYFKISPNEIYIYLYYRINQNNDKFEVYDFTVESSYKTKLVK